MNAAPNYTEGELLQQIAAGSKVAFEVIYKRHYISLYHFANGFVSDRQKAEDITTETFVKLWERFSKFSSLHGIKSFLFTTAKNACLNQNRTEGREATRHQQFVHMLVTEEAGSFGEEPITSRVYQYIYDEIEKLPEDTRRIFKMAYLEGMSNEAIAQALGLTNQSIRNYKSRALKSLRLSLLDKDIFILLGAWLTGIGKI